MNNTIVKDFQNKIVNAGQDDLLMITYDMLFASIEEAMEAIDNEQEAQFNKSMVRAHRLLRELSDNLNFVFDISRDLMSIYIYINKELIDASIHLDSEPLVRSLDVLRVLYNGFDQVKEVDDKKPLIGNSQKVYAGLTYGKGSLNETVYNQNASRGFKA
ncbi:MAG: flagellar protein FliS [Vallitaleaceae bacterium]|jgi:flagellar protein FliS|nr:flagellar protein FliS [Vallitaleaceae bacterium]